MKHGASDERIMRVQLGPEQADDFAAHAFFPCLDVFALSSSPLDLFQKVVQTAADSEVEDLTPT